MKPFQQRIFIHFFLIVLYHISLFYNIFYIKQRYCVIVYVGHFWTFDFSPISVRSLVFTMNYLIFTLIFFFRIPLCR